jgi:hypothetical protein
MMKIFRNRDVPALYVKFEDLQNKEILADVCKFIMNSKSIDGKVIEKRLENLQEFKSPMTFPRGLS